MGKPGYEREDTLIRQGQHVLGSYRYVRREHGTILDAFTLRELYSNPYFLIGRMRFSCFSATPKFIGSSKHLTLHS